MRVPSFCDFGFLKSALEKKNVVVDFLDRRNSRKAMADLELPDLMLHGLAIVTNASAEQISALAEENMYVRFLIKNNRIKAGDITKTLITDEAQYFKNRPSCFEINFMSSMYKPQLDKWQQKSGNFFLSNSCDVSIVFAHSIRSFEPKQKADWIQAAKFLYPHNSLLVADPYIYKEDGIAALLELFRQCIPEKLSVPYSVTLLGSANRLGMDDKAFYQRQINSKLRPQLEKISSNIAVDCHFYSGKEFHDRYIISNNGCIFPGSSMGAFKNSSSSHDTTHIMVRPFKRVDNEEDSAFVFEIMKQKLQKIQSWILKEEGSASNNPLFYTP